MADEPAAMDDTEHQLLSHFLSPGTVVTKTTMAAVHAYRDEVLRKASARIHAEADARYKRHRGEYNAAEVYRPEGMRIAAELINPEGSGGEVAAAETDGQRAYRVYTATLIEHESLAVWPPRPWEGLTGAARDAWEQAARAVLWGARSSG